VLYQFTGGADGGVPEAAVVFDNAGNLYGTASGGMQGKGVVFELTPSASGWTETVLHSFTDVPDGAAPYSAVTFDREGNLYGTTERGGESFGTVYELTPSGSNWTETILYSFRAFGLGANPDAGVVLDPSGNLYGATSDSSPAEGAGNIFQLMPLNGNWLFNVLYTPLSGNGGDFGTLARSANGILYGTLYSGGLQGCFGNGCGSVFQLSPSNGGWVYTSLYEFTDGEDGANPYGGLILDSAGNLYGTTTGSGGGYGSVFEITP
jgi:uncharacterized repeat protein (TIGR03803 family)